MAGEPFGPVIVGVDTSPTSLAALDLAADEAMARVTPLVVVHPVERTGEAALRVLAVAVARTRAEHPGLAVGGEVVVGDPAEVLAERASGASLLVLSGRELAVRMAGRLAVPFIVYRPIEHPPSVVLPRPVLLGVSGPESPVEFAFAEASLRGAPLLAVHVWAAPADTAADHARDDRA